MSNIYSFLSKVALPTILSNASIASAIEQLKFDSMKTLKTFPRNLRAIKKRVDYIYNIFLDSEDQQREREIAESFRETVGNSLDELEKYIDEQQQVKEEILFFEDAFIELIIKVLESILEFQNRLDNLYPGASKDIVDYLGNLLVGIIAVQMPVVGLILKGSGLLESVKSFLSTENLTKTVENWQEKLEIVREKRAEIEKSTNLKEKYSKATQIVEIAEIAGVSPVAVAELGLDIDSLKKINKLVVQDTKEKKSFKKLIDLSEEIPHTKDGIMGGVDLLRKGMTKILGNIPNQGKDLKKLIETELSHIKENLIAALDPNKSILEKLGYCQKAAKNILIIESKIQETVKLIPDREKITTSFANLVKDKTKNILPAYFLKNLTSLRTPLKSLPELLRVGNAMKVVLENNSSKTQGVVRKR
ncbi:MAG: hypothetical protein DMENIID0002_12170 [Rickettsia endosymbiont of Sergentomyia squamirostris]|uniref:Uncharacterized protein n=1 Tax=Candidatus Tisiphia endosymbiont of Sergentomyia squamirostris TaxID=3113639 RepID=A0AAT9G9U6_9RICK